MKKIIIEKLSEEEIGKRGIKGWPVWEKEASRFDWEYMGDERCYFLEGEVEVETADGKVMVRKGDFVTFKDGLKCVWDIRKPVRKHYSYD
jgi:uncharacterized cupin superfamily protein